MNTELARRAVEVSAILKTLSHPVRLRILCGLAEGEKSVSELIEYADASQSWVSQFLSRMRLEGLLEARKDGSFVYYRIADPRLNELLKAIYKTYCAATKRRRSES